MDFHTRTLDHDLHLTAAFELHEAARDHLPEHKKDFIARKTAAELARAMTYPHIGIGVFCVDKLVAQAFLGITKRMRIQEELCRPIAGLSTMQFRNMHRNQTVGAVHGVTVHPAWHGHGLMDVVLHEIVRIGREQKLATVYAEIHCDNTSSRRRFEGNEFTEVGKPETDYRDGSRSHFYALGPSRPAMRPPLRQEADAVECAPSEGAIVVFQPGRQKYAERPNFRNTASLSR